MTAFICWTIVGIINIFRFSRGDAITAFDYWMCYACLMLVILVTNILN